MRTAAQAPSASAVLRDVIALTKPRITLMVIITAAGGIWLAPGTLDMARTWVMLLTTAAVVGGANALNCYLERDSDRLMERTASRPLPDGRLQPNVALWLGLALGLFSVPILALAVNPLTGLLGGLALGSYVLIYTPMKRLSPTALLVGAVPGALPPLMGWTAVTGGLEEPGLVLFAILFLWQIPHFIAISVFRQEDYERAGLKVLPSVRGIRTSKVMATFYAALLVPVSLLLYPMRVAGPYYLVTALVLNIAFVGAAAQGFRAEDDIRWSRKLFGVSLVYLTVLFTVLMLDSVG